MITDPDEPGYRYPELGEELWHRPTRQIVVVTGRPVWGPNSVDEVEVVCPDAEPGHRLACVKLRSLDELAGWLPSGIAFRED